MQKFEKLFKQLQEKTAPASPEKDKEFNMLVDGEFLESVIGSNPQYMKFIMTKEEKDAGKFSADKADEYKQILVARGKSVLYRESIEPATDVE